MTMKQIQDAKDILRCTKNWREDNYRGHNIELLISFNWEYGYAKEAALFQSFQWIIGDLLCISNVEKEADLQNVRFFSHNLRL